MFRAGTRGHGPAYFNVAVEFIFRSHDHVPVCSIGIHSMLLIKQSVIELPRVFEEILRTGTLLTSRISWVRGAVRVKLRGSLTKKVKQLPMRTLREALIAPGAP